MAKERVSAGGSADDSGGTLEGRGQGSEGEVDDGGWYKQGWKADDTGSGSGPACSGPCTGKSQVRGFQRPPYAPPSPGHTVLSGRGPPILAEDDPRSYTGLSNSQDPCDYHILLDPVGADWDLLGALCFL